MLAVFGCGKALAEAESRYTLLPVRLPEMVGNGSGFRGYANAITELPQADIPFEGVKAWILQGETHQLVFFQMEANAKAPAHSHDYAQWGMVIEGSMELTVEGKARTYGKGDEYLVPAGATHEARFLTKCRIIDLFSERTRYRAKATT
jgi:quercetin dioxygenase-like cupin family protein